MPARNISLLVITSLLISCDSADVTHETAKQFVSTEYMCENKEYLSVVFSSSEAHPLYAKISYKNSSYNLKRVPAASGEKYSDGKNIWWSKGDAGFLQINNIIVLKNCTPYKPIETQALKANKRMHPSWDTNNDSINDCESDGSCDHTIDYSKPRVR